MFYAYFSVVLVKIYRKSKLWGGQIKKERTLFLKVAVRAIFSRAGDGAREKQKERNRFVGSCVA